VRKPRSTRTRKPPFGKASRLGTRSSADPRNTRGRCRLLPVAARACAAAIARRFHRLAANPNRNPKKKRFRHPAKRVKARGKIRRNGADKRRRPAPRRIWRVEHIEELWSSGCGKRFELPTTAVRGIDPRYGNRRDPTGAGAGCRAWPAAWSHQQQLRTEIAWASPTSSPSQGVKCATQWTNE